MLFHTEPLYYDLSKASYAHNDGNEEWQYKLHQLHHSLREIHNCYEDACMENLLQIIPMFLYYDLRSRLILHRLSIEDLLQIFWQCVRIQVYPILFWILSWQ